MEFWNINIRMIQEDVMIFLFVKNVNMNLGVLDKNNITNIIFKNIILTLL
jgi:hypothetical protein